MSSRVHLPRRWRALAGLGCVLLLAGCDANPFRKARVLPDNGPAPATPDAGTPVQPTDICQQQPRDPGRVTLHRLNRAEYDNTVRDVLGDTSHPASDFPADDHGYGFDNNADVLSMSPLLMEKYAVAAEHLVEDAWTRGTVRMCQLDADNPEPCARQILSTFARRAWRRPVTDEEVRRLLAFVSLAHQHGDAPEAGVKLGLRSVLLSPHFLFRVEQDAQPASPAPHSLNDYELASRLSYFLWSSAPDETLLALANEGRLHDSGVLEEQVRRMLADPKAQALVDNFAGQWLYLRALDVAQPDPVLYPGFDEPLRGAMRQETQLVFSEFLHGDLPLRDMLDAPFTYVNDRLALLYGLPPPGSDALKRVDLSGAPNRLGLLGQGAILTVTSHSDRTSPVKRGLWVLEQLLCKAPPPPPPNVPSLPPPVNPNATMRERMEAHRASPQCSGCHSMMDPIGFGLENFDAIGGWRVKEAGTGTPVDASGKLPDGETFTGPAELRTILKQDTNLPSCITEHLLTYALGRGTSEADACAVRDIVQQAEAHGGRLRDYIQALVQSEPFTQRRGEAPGGTQP